MIVVLDTNIFQQDYLVKSSRFTILRDYIERTQSRLIVPAIVADELLANYERDIESRIQAYHRSRDTLLACLTSTLPDEPNIAPTQEAARYKEYLFRTLKFSPDTIYQYKPEYLSDIVNRAVKRIPPCTKTGGEMRDAILWCMVKDIARELGEGSAVLISNNTKQFATSDGTLHPILFDEMQKAGLEITYYKSLEDFAREHASRIGFISSEWLKEQVKSNDVVASVRDRLESNLALKIPPIPIGRNFYTGHTRLIGGDLTLTDFYVNELRDGSYRVEATLAGNLDFEVEVLGSGPDPLLTGISASGFSFPLQFPITFSGSGSPITRPQPSYEHVSSYAEVTIDIAIRGQQVLRWDVINFSIKSP